MIAQPLSLDLMFGALADPTRRRIVERLSHGPAFARDLAGRIEISLPSLRRHLAVLEASGLVASNKIGRMRRFSVQLHALQEIESWVGSRGKTTEDRDAL
jgi:DNA-binding transcriptional ArsR family regulator